MAIDRRKFLKIAGLSFLFGTGVFSLEEFVLCRGDEVLAQVVGEGKKGKVRWAMAIDTRRLTEEDCKRIIEACHRAHNVPDIPEPTKAVRWIWEDTFEHAFPELAEEDPSEELRNRKYLLLCNHCENPVCVRVCPVQATFQRPDGIVVQDYHSCIGCKFCMTACPYGSRSYNFYHPKEYLKHVNPEYPARTMGVVEKCTFCYERLDQGKLPYCVEAAKGKIYFGNIYDPEAEITRVIKENLVLVRKPQLGTKPMVFYIV